MGAYTHLTPPSGEIFVSYASTSQYLIVFLISTIYSSSTFRDIRGSQIYIRGLCAPRRPPSGKFLTYAQVLADVYITVNFQLPSSINAGLKERSALSIIGFALKGPPKCFLGDFGGRG